MESEHAYPAFSGLDEPANRPPRVEDRSELVIPPDGQPSPDWLEAPGESNWGDPDNPAPREQDDLPDPREAPEKDPANPKTPWVPSDPVADDPDIEAGRNLETPNFSQPAEPPSPF